jgi:2-keto-3-deoxy-L-rhamnonate aldolase RhmA
MTTNTRDMSLDLRTRLRRRRPTTAAFLDLGSPVSAQITALAGFDAVVVDLEHGAGDESAARSQIVAAQPSALIIVRTPDGPTQIARMLDFGADGVLLPRLGSAAEAAQAAPAVRYASGRGVSGLARSVDFGTGARAGWRADADAATACIVQIERSGALDEVDAIAALDDVDALLVGPADLANDLGCEANLDASPLREAAQRVIEAAVGHGKTAGIHFGGGEDPVPWVQRGVTLISSSFESAVLLKGSRAVATQLRDAFADR